MSGESIDRRWLPRLVVVVLGLLLLAALARLFVLRFAAGDVYPAYSTLRADPRGTRAFYEALGATGLDVRRNFRDLARAPLPVATIHVAGEDWSAFARTEAAAWRALLDAVSAGARLVISFAPTAPPDRAFERLAEQLEDARRRTGAGGGETAPPAERLPEHLGLRAEWLQARPATERFALRSTDGPAAFEPLPDALPWNTALTLAGDDPAWSVVYRAGNHAALLERAWGAGRIVVLADAFLVSNEAMAARRQTSLLAWLQGPLDRAVFDESHLGVAENRGVATLARRFGLEPVALALLLVAVLFVWRGSASLIPPEDALAAAGAEGDADEFVGRESAAGLVSLLRRALPPANLFAEALREYRRSSAWRRLGEARRAALDQLGSRPAGRADDALRNIREAHAIIARRH